MQIWWLKLAIKTVILCGCLRLLREQQRNTPLTLEAIELFLAQTEIAKLDSHKLLNSNMCVCIFLNYVRFKTKRKKKQQNIRLDWATIIDVHYKPFWSYSFLISKVKEKKCSFLICLPNYTAMLCKQKLVFSLRISIFIFLSIKEGFSILIC